MNTPRADDWRERGGYFSWRPAQEDASPVEIFHVEIGDHDAPVLLLIHGWPTSSIDWFEVAGPLSATFRVCALDFPGYGFSDKPQGWGYSLTRDEELIEFYVSEVIGADAGVVVAHDRGDSVALLHAARCAGGRSAMRIDHLVLSNGNIFLPLSNLTQAQRLILDADSWPQMAAALTPSRLAEGMGATTFTPPREAGDPEVEALTAIFAHNDGIKVLHEGIQYLVERSQDEQAWLAALAGAPFPVTVIWGLNDTVSPPRVATSSAAPSTCWPGSGATLVVMNDIAQHPVAAGGGPDADDPTGRLAAFEARTQVPLDLLALVTLWLTVVPPWDFGHDVVVYAARISLSVVYAVDLGIRSALARRHVHYALAHPVALASVVWPPVRVLFSLRLARSMFRRGHLERFLVAALLLVFNGAAIAYLYERHAPGSNIHTLGESVWWSLVTVTTVGYGDYTPVTVPGRITACCLMGIGLVTLAVLTAQVASSFVTQGASRARRDPEPEPAPSEVTLAELDRRLARIEELLIAAAPSSPRTPEAPGRGPGSI